MPVMNFDLEDGLEPVSFTLKPDDCERFMDFMAECSNYKTLIREVNAHLVVKILSRMDISRADECMDSMNTVSLSDLTSALERVTSEASDHGQLAVVNTYLIDSVLSRADPSRADECNDAMMVVSLGELKDELNKMADEALSSAKKSPLSGM